MVGDFGATSDFHTKKATDYGDFRLSEYPATFRITSDYQIFTQASDYETDMEKSRFRNTQTLPNVCFSILFDTFIYV